MSAIARREKAVVWSCACLLALIASFICFWNLSATSFSPADESLHVRVAQEMLHGGSLVQPTLRGAPYFNKPPLQMWLLQIPLRIFGESNLSYRLVSATSGVLTVLLTFCLALRFLGSSSAGVAAGLALLGWRCFVELHGARQGVQDSFFLLLLTCSLACFWESLRADDSGGGGAGTRRFAFCAGIFSGLACLTKSFVGWFPFVVVLFYLLIRGGVVLIRREQVTLVAALLPALVVPMSYFVPHWIFTPGAFQVSVVHELLNRAAKGYHHQSEPFFYLVDLWRTNHTASLTLFVFAWGWGLIRFRQSGDNRLLFLLVWSISSVLIFSIPRSKLPWYLAPSYPAIALLIGGMMVDLIRLVHSASSKVGGSTVTQLSILCALMFGFAFHEIAFNLSATTKHVLTRPKRKFFDRVVAEVRARLHADPKRDRVLYVGDTGLRVERDIVYIDFLHQHALRSGSVEEARAVLQSGQIAVVILPSGEVSSLRGIAEPKTVIFGPLKSRKMPVAIASYREDIDVTRALRDEP